MAGAFTLAFSYYAGLEGITYGKVLGIIACFLGAVCVGLNDTGDGNGQMQTVTGDIVAFFGAVGYGLYTTIIRYKVSFDAETVFYFWFHFSETVNIYHHVVFSHHFIVAVNFSFQDSR